jgi:hypothetical protein
MLSLTLGDAPYLLVGVSILGPKVDEDGHFQKCKLYGPYFIALVWISPFKDYFVSIVVYVVGFVLLWLLGDSCGWVYNGLCGFYALAMWDAPYLLVGVSILGPKVDEGGCFQPCKLYGPHFKLSLHVFLWWSLATTTVLFSVHSR